ncbi:MAG: amidohydrolase [Planctomycetaceae bacterium]
MIRLSRHRAVHRGVPSLAAVVVFLVVFLVVVMAAGSLSAGHAAEIPSVEDWLAAHLDEVVALYTDLHRAPELSLAEVQTAARMADELRALGAEVTTGVGGHGVVGVLRSPGGHGPVLMVRADMDALPIVEQTGLPYASTVRTQDDRGAAVGVMHACGHDAHMAALIGGLECLASRRGGWSGTILAVLQPAEEKGGGAASLLADGLFARFPRPAAAVALHCAADRAAGVVATMEGPTHANVDSVDITIRGRGGHGAAPHATIDPILTAARLVVDLQSLVSREIDPLSPAVVTVGSIHGGTKHNVIPDDCHLQLTVRSFTAEVRTRLLDGIRRKAFAAAAAAGGPEPEVVFSKETTPALHNDPAVTTRVTRALRRALGDDCVQADAATMGGEDFSRYGKAGVPSCMFRLGTVAAERLAAVKSRGETPPSLHSPRYAPDARTTLATGIAAWVAVVEEFLPPHHASGEPAAAGRP